MQIHNNTLIAECSAYDFKEMLECKKVKSWLKSVSAFANTDGGSLFYGVNDDGVIVGLENPQADADFISEMIKARLDPVPEVQLIPIEHEGHTLLEVKVKAGTLTPYYYYQDGTRTAYMRIGNESVECNSQQLLSLVLKGTHMTWDSLPTQVDASKHSFIILANTFREQTHQEWNDKYLESFGLVTPDGKLTNAGLLFVDNCTVFQSRIFCTRWTGLYKDDAISSVEHRANLVLLLKYGMDFIKNYYSWMLSVRGLAKSTAFERVNTLKWLMYLAMDEGWIHKHPFKKFVCKPEYKKRPFLSEEDLQRVISVKLSYRRQQAIRDMFVFMCFSGLAHADLKELSYRNVHTDSDGNTWLVGNRVKTKAPYVVKLLPIAVELIEKYRGVNEFKVSPDRVFPVGEIGSMEDSLKRIGEKAGCSVRVSPHVGRHTFATLALSKGMPLETLQKVLGHKTIISTQVYAELINPKIGEDTDRMREKIGGMFRLAY